MRVLTLQPGWKSSEDTVLFGGYNISASFTRLPMMRTMGWEDCPPENRTYSDSVFVGITFQM